jgi:hypothetical protein
MYSKLINHLHKIVIIYITFGFLLESQRKYLTFFLPTIQFQFLINENMCILTQLENKILEYESKKDESKREVLSDSFIGKTLQKYNINISPSSREKLIHCALYSSFCLNYFLS